MRSRLAILFGLLLSFSFAAAYATDQQFTDFEDLNLDSLLDEIVVSASREPWSITEAPAAVSVLTRDDIRASGARTIPDALRMVPGVDVLYITNADYQVNIRGFSGSMANKTLVLVDGRSIYWEFYGMTVWDAIQVTLEEVERIEVIRGPGSVTYGPNAFSGAINIVTRAPRDMAGQTTVTMVGGSPSGGRGSLLHAAEIEKAAFKISAGWGEQDGFGDEDPLAARYRKFNLAVDRPVGRSGSLYAAGGFTDGDGFTMSGIGEMVRDNRLGYAMLGYDRGPVHTRGYWNTTRADVTQQVSSDQIYFDVDSYDIESHYQLLIQDRGSLLIGANARLFRGSSDALGTSFHEELVSGFVEGSHRPVPHVLTSAGFRVDRYPLTGTKVSPRVSVHWNLREGQSLRSTFATAYRDPSIIESYLHLTTDLSAKISPLLPKNTIEVHSRGNTSLDPEKITSFQLGYSAAIGKALWLRLDGFHHIAENFVAFGTTDYSDVSELLGLPSGSVIVPSEATYSNLGEARFWGGEVSLDLFPSARTRILTNYSVEWNSSRPSEDGAGGALGQTEFPVHHFNLALFHDVNRRLRSSFWVNGVSETFWTEDVATGRVPAYATVNLTARYLLPALGAELSLSVGDLLDQGHREYPGLDQSGEPNGSEVIGRRITGGLQVAF